MSNNTNLHKAKQAKNDEFYTRYEDIESELSHYPVKYFKDKVIYCPCDVGVEWLDVPRSNFIKYFEDNKKRLGYKKLLHTSLQEGYDFRSEECKQYFEEADIVVTNPPFSLFREFIATLEKYKLKFVIVGNQNAITYKGIFPLIKEGKLWMGTGKSYSSLAGYFSSTYDDVAVSGQHKEGSIRVSGVCWFTNIDHFKLHEPILLVKTYNPNDYPKYDNYDAIEVKKTKDIPCDYDGLMGVPITFMHKYNPEQFEIVDLAKRGTDYMDLRTKIYDKREYPNAADLNAGPTIKVNGELKNVYARILIRRKGVNYERK